MAWLRTQEAALERSSSIAHLSDRPAGQMAATADDDDDGAPEEMIERDDE
jgi:hypothetical protein